MPTIHSHKDLMKNTVFLSSCTFVLKYLNIYVTKTLHHGKESEHVNYSHADLRISSISSEETST